MTRIATFNVNGVNGRLPVLLRWLAETRYDIVCLQELKTSDEKFPVEAIRDAGYQAIWHGQKSYNGVAILARGADPVGRRRGLPGDPDDTHSRYIEAEIFGLIVGCLYCQTAIRPPDQNSITSFAGSSASGAMPNHCSVMGGQPFFAATTTSCRRPSTRWCQGVGWVTRFTFRRVGRPMPRCWPTAGLMRFGACIPRRAFTPIGISLFGAGTISAPACAWTTF
jgi:hypothetical protein